MSIFETVIKFLYKISMLVSYGKYRGDFLRKSSPLNRYILEWNPMLLKAHLLLNKLNQSEQIALRNIGIYVANSDILNISLVGSNQNYIYFPVNRNIYGESDIGNLCQETTLEFIFMPTKDVYLVQSESKINIIFEMLNIL